jgi:hypothetical protein
MRSISCSFVALFALGCNGGDNAGGTLYDFNTTPFGGVNIWEGQVADVNVDGQKVGTTDDPVLIPAGDHTVTFGDMSNTITTGDGTELPIVTAPDGRTWIANPIIFTDDGSRARHEPGHEDTALTDTGAPADTAGTGGGGTPPEPVYGTFLAPEGPYMCQDPSRTQTISMDNVTYPDASTMDMEELGIMDILGVLLNIPDDGTTELRGNFTGETSLTVNIIPADGSDVVFYDCWAGTLCDRPWDTPDPSECP